MRTWIIGINRLLLAALAAIPFLFLQPFYHHFHVYLTGTVINGIVKQQWHLVLLSIGWFFGWPTILTVIFSPILVYKYIKAARSEEADMIRLNGDDYVAYMKDTPFLI